MNEENEWDHKISLGLRKDQQIVPGLLKVTSVLKKMKRHKAQDCRGW